MNKNISEYMAKIGGKGGAKRASHPDRIEMARKAALARWNAKRLCNNNHASSKPNDKIAENKV